MPPVVYLILATLAVYRTSRMLALEEGPFSIFSKLQGWTEKQSNWVSRGLHCPLCISFWFALVAALFFLPLSLPEFLLVWLGIAGGALALYQRYH